MGVRVGPVERTVRGDQLARHATGPLRSQHPRRERLTNAVASLIIYSDIYSLTVYPIVFIIIYSVYYLF